MKKAIYFILAVLAVCLASYFAGRVKGRKMGREAGYSEGYEAGWNAPHPADTSVVIDTTHHDKPKPSEVRPADDRREKLLLGTIAELQARLDSLAAAKPDTAFVEIPIPIEVKTYADSTYRAQVSGWHPSLDWIEVYQRTQTINNYIVQPTPYDWTISAVAGVDAQQGLYRARAGVLYDRRITGGLRWSAEAGYQAGNLGRGIYGEVRLRLDMLHSH